MFFGSVTHRSSVGVFCSSLYATCVGISLLLMVAVGPVPSSCVSFGRNGGVQENVKHRTLSRGGPYLAAFTHAGNSSVCSLAPVSKSNKMDLNRCLRGQTSQTAFPGDAEPHRENSRGLTLSATRTPLVGGNWKCNGTKESVEKLINMLNSEIRLPPDQTDVQVVVAPPFLHTGYVRDNLRRSDIKVATQNVALAPGYGAFTGEISADMVKDFGLEWVITGHSERRQGFGMAGEDSELVGEKTRVALEKGLNVIACIGERLDDRDKGRTAEVLNEQLTEIAEAIGPAGWAKVVLAYEPVWAIGTGKSATPAMAQDTHSYIRMWLSERVNPAVAEATRVLYGGSVKASNADELIQQRDVDGFLVGGASLNPEFVAIITAAAKQKTAQTA